MKRFLHGLLIFTGLLTGLCENAQSQVYNNEWINYNNTYYKFKIGATGLYRINQATLTSLGLGSTPAEQFQLWRNGKEVSLYTSVPTGTMGGSDYIEFWGEMNDGKPDNVLYRNADYQLNDKWSLQTDTAAFFLTVNPSGSNLRLEPAINDIAGNALPPEPFFMHTVGSYWKQMINGGFANVVGEYVYSSVYDQGEGWSTGNIYAGTPLAFQYANLFHYTGPGAPAPIFKVNASGNALNQRQIFVRLNGDTILNQSMDFFDYIKTTAPVTTPEISSDTANIEIINGGLGASDRFVVAQNELIYARQFNFGNARNFYFELPANTNGNYLEISNFNYGSAAPVLYDLSNGKRYVADITNPSLIKIALLPSSIDRKLVLVSEEVVNITDITSFQQRNFVNLNLSTNQGNYLIISNPVLTNGSGGSNPVDNYRAYRSSVTGGGYNAKVYMIDELVDQFGLGIKKNPLAIRNFILWARSHFSTVPIKNVFLIGKGVTYNQYRVNESNPDIEKLCLVPTFGNPGSDNLLTADPGLNEIPKVPIGRLSAINADEVALYLSKVVQYEQVQVSSSPLIQDKAWMKNVMHVVGASDENLGNLLDNYMIGYKNIISDTLYGGSVHTFSKTSANAVQQASNQELQNLFQEGLSLVTYFGHSSSSTLEFNLDNPQNYNNPGKYPVFILLGCNAGNFFNFNVARFQTQETISEKYVLAQQRGGIACIASTHFGIVHYLDIINTRTYTAAATTHYGQTLGETMIESAIQTYNSTTQNDYYARFHCEQLTLHGDPAIRLNASAKPDYVIEDPLVKISPSFISIAESQFKVDATFMNIGKAVNKNIVVEVKRTYPNLTTEVIKRDTIPGIRFIDSLTYTIPIIATRDKGLNKITITVDADNDVDELYETNNSVTKDVFIFEDEARPVYPNDFAIVNRQNIKLLASTADPFAPLKQYKMELDTTELFNSSFKVTRSISSIGGIIEFDPGITFTDSTVYYWRVGIVPSSGTPKWNNASFIYLASSDPGFNQSHYFQHLKSDKKNISLDPGRDWKFDSLPHFLFAKNGVFLTASGQEGDFIVAPDGDPYIRSACVGYSLIFNIFDPKKFSPNLNLTGQYGSALPCQPSRRWNYEYSYMFPDKRKLAMDFMDSIPDGYIVVVRNILNSLQVGGFINEWEADTALYGPNNSLYHKLKSVGFNQIDSFTSLRSFIYIYKKNDNSFVPVSAVTNGKYDLVSVTKNLETPDTLGYITSPMFGKAKAWKQLKWRGAASPDTIPGDTPSVDVIGVDLNGIETVLFSGLTTSQQDYDISGIDAAQYPYVKLKMRNSDSVNFTPYQLQYWRLTYDPVPEGAIAPNLYYYGKDSVELGEPLSYGIAFKNISDIPFADSMKAKFVITNQNNVQTIVLAKQKVMQPGDTVRFDVPVESRLFAGHNTVFFNFNPDYDQPEQYNFNNFAFRNLYVKPDSLNPLLDVTFDGLHILNRDIISPKPDIIVKLKDEAKWMILDDTSLLTLQVRYPNGSLRQFYFNNDTLHFTPAGQAPNPDNTATLNFKPYFTKDGVYELIVTGKDRSGNAAGNIEYRVAFEVINKPMISNMLNYPNPFTTSTAFVFTITGYEIPQNIKIEIMTITGKIVREITKDELGPLRIGRNITEFKWDGTDQYGQKLANGIYLYRVVTNLNGKVLDKYKSESDNTDKYFNKGYGKMYLMR
jgi:Peptidase family C25/CARDB